MKRKPKLDEAIFDAVYQQSRVNKALGRVSKGDVDLLASREYADAFHDLLVHQYPSHHGGAKGDMRWQNTKLAGPAHLKCRTYEARQMCHPLCRVHVIICPGRKVFAVLNWLSLSGLDLLTGKQFPFPPSPSLLGTTLDLKKCGTVQSPTPLPKRIQKMLDAELERDRKAGNNFWTTPMTKEKLAPITDEEWKRAWKEVVKKKRPF